MMFYLRHLISRLFTFGEDKEKIVLDVLGDEEMFGLNIMRQSKGRIGRAGVYNILGSMEQRGLLTSRPVKKIVTIRETFYGKVHEREHEVKQRMYRRGIPPARVL